MCKQMRVVFAVSKGQHPWFVQFAAFHVLHHWEMLQVVDPGCFFLDARPLAFEDSSATSQTSSDNGAVAHNRPDDASSPNRAWSFTLSQRMHGLRAQHHRPQRSARRVP